MADEDAGEDGLWASARRHPVITDEIIYVMLNDDVDVNSIWWDGSANAFYSGGEKGWTQAPQGHLTPPRTGLPPVVW